MIELQDALKLIALRGRLMGSLPRGVMLSVRATEQLVRKRLQPSAGRKSPPADPDVTRLEVSLSEKLGAPVRIQRRGGEGRGRLIIDYHSLDELDGILSRLD